MLKLIVMVLQSMEIEVELPITVFVDNIGDISLENYCTTNDHTKHMDIHYSLWSLILTTLFETFWNFLCDPHRTYRVCTRVGLVISEYHPIDEFKQPSA